MNKLIFLIAFSALLVGCGKIENPITPVEDVAPRLRIYTDPDTKCQYLQPRGSRKTALTPRVDANGKHVCGTLVTAPLPD